MNGNVQDGDLKAEKDVKISVKQGFLVLSAVKKSCRPSKMAMPMSTNN
jgi:hypothetical protein